MIMEFGKPQKVRPDWAPMPTFPLRERLFGKPRAIGFEGGLWMAEPEWLEETMSEVYILGKFYPCHRLAVEPILGLFNAWDKADLTKLVLSVDRVYEFRPTSTGQFFLPHTHGNAFDINGEWNPTNKPPAREGEKGCVLPLLEIARAHGFWCGADWASPTGKHFELTRLP